MAQVSTIGLDRAKNVFQVHGIDAQGKVLVRWPRVDIGSPASAAYPTTVFGSRCPLWSMMRMGSTPGLTLSVMYPARST
jgi:hypothetical protein